MLRRLARGFAQLRVNHLAGGPRGEVFNFSAENERAVEALLRRYPANYRRSAMIPLLFLAQKQNGNLLSLAAMEKVAEVLEVPAVDVFEVASFYTMFNREPVGRFHLQVCGTTPCMICGAEGIVRRLERHLGVRLGQTTPDGLFTLSEVECLGACVNAPMLQVNNEHVYEDLTEESVVQLVEDLRHGRPVAPGPQNHRRNSEGPLGRTTLLEAQAETRHDRDFAAAKAEWERAREEAATAARVAKEEAMKAAGQPSKPAEPPKEAKPAEPVKEAKPAEPVKEAEGMRAAEKLKEYSKPRAPTPPAAATIRRAVAHDAEEVGERREAHDAKPGEQQPVAAPEAPDGKVLRGGK